MSPRWLDPDRAWVPWKRYDVGLDVEDRRLGLLAYDHHTHAAFGVLMVLLMHLPGIRTIFAPWVLEGWLAQVLVASFVGFAYEVRDALDFLVHTHAPSRAAPDQGFGLVDWLYVTAGALVMVVLLNGMEAVL